MAKRHGAADQIDDPSLLDTIVFRRLAVEVFYAPARDVFTFVASLAPDAPAVEKRAQIPQAEAKIRSKLRLLRSTGEAQTLYGETPVAGLGFHEFAEAFDAFLDFVAQARNGTCISEEQFTSRDELPSDDLIWIRG